MNTTENKQFQVALNGLTKISSGQDHVWCVYAAWGSTFLRADLTYGQAQELAAHLEAKR